MWAGDLNGDGRINSTDVILMRRFILEIINVFPKSNMHNVPTNIVLEEDMSLNGLDMKEGTLDLNGYELTIEGDFNHSGGTVNVNGGRLIVNGNYYIGNARSGVPGTGKLVMINKSDYIKVTGNFLMYSSYDHTGLLNEGTIEITGSFTQKYGGSASNFPASGHHKVKLSGRDTTLQTVSFDNVGNSKINILEVRYPIEFYELIDIGLNSQSVFGNDDEYINIFSISTFSEKPFYEKLIEEFNNDVVNEVTKGVNTSEGSFSYRIDSMNVRLVGFDLNVGASYNSRKKESKMFGNGWTFNYEGWILRIMVIMAS
ncbi:UNVERIFIED_CONTAM: dockerin type I repeat protein [Acetivibrio alkalicellulosi]